VFCGCHLGACMLATPGAGRGCSWRARDCVSRRWPPLACCLLACGPFWPPRPWLALAARPCGGGGRCVRACVCVCVCVCACVCVCVCCSLRGVPQARAGVPSTRGCAQRLAAGVCVAQHRQCTCVLGTRWCSCCCSALRACVLWRERRRWRLSRRVRVGTGAPRQALPWVELRRLLERAAALPPPAWRGCPVASVWSMCVRAVAVRRGADPGRAQKGRHQLVGPQGCRACRAVTGALPAHTPCGEHGSSWPVLLRPCVL
jgi:hypothetical protein